jgi:hypothetical protein
VRMIEAWVADSKRAHRFPAAFVPAFCKVLRNDDLKRWMNCPRFTEHRELRQRIIELTIVLARFLKQEGKGPTRNSKSR